MNRVTSNQSATKKYIGLLDVYGFEFFETNSFEQLCINFANEKLQQYFLVTVFTGEEQQYKEEGIPWTPIPYSDNAEIIDLIENTKNGIYTTLDSCCKTGSSTGQKFCAALHDTHSKSKVLAAPKVGKKETRSKTDYFVVKHFAGDGACCCRVATAAPCAPRVTGLPPFTRRLLASPAQLSTFAASSSTRTMTR